MPPIPASIARPACLAYVLAATLLTSTAVQASPTKVTTYKYYNVTGSTPVEIHRSILSRGPEVKGMDAYGTTVADATPTGRLVAGATCRIADYDLKMNFVIHLPRHSRENALLGATKASWSKFKTFVREHELQHTRIWMSCARDFENRAKSLRASNCSALNSAANALWKQMQANCDAKHRDFDRSEQGKLLRQPFVRQALDGRSSGKSKILPVSPAQRAKKASHQPRTARRLFDWL